MDVLHSPQSVLTNPDEIVAVVRDSPWAIIEVNTDGRVQLWNHQAESLFGYSATQVLGRPLPIEASERARAEDDSDISPIIHPTLSQFETQLLHRDGTPIDVGIWHTPVHNSEHDIIGHVACIVDLRNRKALENALLQTMEAESRRLGRCLHDSLSQQLLGAAFAARSLSNQLVREGVGHADQLDQLIELINEAVREARAVAQGLNPIERDSCGLESALTQLAARGFPTVEIKFECPRPVLMSDEITALHAYRIAQETVSRAISEGNANQVSINLLETAGRVVLKVVHNAVKLPRNSDAERAIRYRVQAIHGSVVENRSSDGFSTFTLYFSKV